MALCKILSAKVGRLLAKSYKFVSFLNCLQTPRGPFDSDENVLAVLIIASRRTRRLKRGASFYACHVATTEISRPPSPPDFILSLDIIPDPRPSGQVVSCESGREIYRHSDSCRERSRPRHVLGISMPAIMRAARVRFCKYTLAAQIEF